MRIRLNQCLAALMLVIPAVVNIHDVELAKRYADRIVGMSGGYVIYAGAPDRLPESVLKQIYGGEDWLS